MTYIKNIKDCFWHSTRTGCFGEPKDCCGRYMPDSLRDCEGVCEYYEPKNEQLHLDYGDVVNVPCSSYEEPCKVVIEGVGKDAEVVVNENGGKQSKTPMALHLVTPEFIQIASYDLPKSNIKNAIDEIITFMTTDEWYSIDPLFVALKQIEPDRIQQMFKIGKVMQEGADRYEPNNWRLIPQEIHINHALIHLFAAALGDTQDNHLDHALCRLMFACNTEPSKGFSYTKYKGKAK